MINESPELYFKSEAEWYDWLMENHDKSKGVFLIFHKLELNIPTMRWEEAVQMALCYGWIDSTVKSLGDGKRKQYFCPRNPKGGWSALNKKYVKELIDSNLMHESGYKLIEIAKQNGSWTLLDDVENLVIPKDLQNAFNKNPLAFENYLNFSKTYKKSYLSWLIQAKRETTRQNRIEQIIELCSQNKKTR